MNFALSQEGDIVKLFLYKADWTKLYPLLEKETVTVKLFGVWMEANSIGKNLPRGSDGYITIRLRNQILPLDTILVGQSRTQSSSNLVTDSAAGATAFSCGLKSYNGAIGGELVY